MVDSRLEKLAKLCVHYSVGLKPRENVIVRGSAMAFPLIHELYKECLLCGAYPVIFPRLETEYTFFKTAKEHQLKYVPPLEKFIAENVDVSIGIFCDPSPKGLTSIDPAKIRTRRAAGAEISKTLFRREAEGKFR